VQSTLDVTKKTFKIEMKQAKIKAKEMFEQMLTDRLQACEDTYKSEFNNLMKQF
jgi:hypothetical protein